MLVGVRVCARACVGEHGWASVSVYMHVWASAWAHSTTAHMHVLESRLHAVSHHLHPHSQLHILVLRACVWSVGGRLGETSVWSVGGRLVSTFWNV